MNNKKNKLTSIEERLRSFFQKKAESLKVGQSLWTRLEPRLGEQSTKANIQDTKMKFGRWFAGPRLVIVSTSLSVILILIVIGSVWLTSPPNRQSSIAFGGTTVTPVPEAVNANSGQGVIIPRAPQITVTTATTTMALPVPTTTVLPGGGSPSYGNSSSSSSNILDTAQRDVIYDASISLTVNDVSTAVTQVQTIAQNAGGFVDNMSSGSGQGQQQAAITIRVPQDQFFTTLNKIQELGTAQSQNISSQDVTQQFIDLQARLKSAQLEEQSLQSLLDKAQTISDIISIQEQLTQVRSDIESLQGQINYIQNRVDMASITVNLNTITKSVGQPPSASLTVAVSNVDSSLAAVEQMVSSVNGVVNGDSISLNNGKESAYLSLMVYRSNFDQTLLAIEKQGKTQQKTVQEAVASQVDQSSQQSNTPPDASITVSLIEVSGFWTSANIAVIAIAGSIVVIALLIFLGLAYRAGLLRKRTS